MANSKSPCWQARRDLEDGPMADVAECKIAAGVIVAQARSIGHRRILAETYRLSLHLERLTCWLSAQWSEAEVE